jgi:hypothetical protein
VTAPGIGGRVAVGSVDLAIVQEDQVLGGRRVDSPRERAAELVDRYPDAEYVRHTFHLGKGGVDDGYWESLRDRPSSGPNCPVCTGERGTDGMETTIHE